MYPGNHTDSEILYAPRYLKTRPGAPQTQLAYVTPEEEGILASLRPGTPHRGPEGIPNYDAFSWDPTPGGGGAALETGGGGEWQESAGGQSTQVEPRDYSYSTQDVRSTPTEREAFRERTNQVSYEGGERIISEGHYVETPAERLARTAHDLTGNPNYLNKPIYIPEGMTGAQIENLIAMGQQGRRSEFFAALGQTADITAGNPNIDYSTQYDPWYAGTPVDTDGDNRGGRRYGYGYGYDPGSYIVSGGYGYGYGGDPNYIGKTPFDYGDPYSEARYAPLEQHERMVDVNTPRYAARGGIMNLRR